MTFSIVATDLHTGEMGVAIATARPAVGALCPFAVPGVGVVATQAIVNPQLAVSALAELAAGADAQTAMRRALAADPGREQRQLLVANAKGEVASFTGESVGQWAGSFNGAGFAVGGNLLVGGAVISKMVSAFVESRGRLADRLLAALAAGDSMGGDKRGRQSAAILVVAEKPWPSLNLRVDDHATPVLELKRLFGVWRAYWEPYQLTGKFPPASPPGPPPQLVGE
jgi:uncharacterized Ntn-hydrolase superfamily protein